MTAAALITAILIVVLLRQRVGATPPADVRILAEHVVDLVSTHDRDGTFRYVSSAFAGMLGEYPGALRGKHPRDFAHPDDIQAIDGLWKRTIASGDSASVTWRCRRHSGEFAWLESSARATITDMAELGRIVCASRDVTERKQIEDALRDSESRFRSTLETLRLVAVGLDTQGRVTFANDALCALTGWSRAELIGENWFERCLPDAASRNAFYSNIATGNLRPEIENEIVCRDGSRRTIDWDNTVLRTPQGDVLGTASLGADVTARRQQEASLKLLQSITLAISAAQDLNSALALTLESICSATGWGYGEAWMPTSDGQQLERATHYVMPGVQCDALIDAGAHARFARGEGLPGSAWRSKTVDFLDFEEDPSEPSERQSVAARCGFRTAVAVPVLAAGEVVAVLAFFTDRRRPADERHIQMIFVVANQVGEVIERRRAQKQYESQILQARDEAEAANQAKSDFLSRMSHELRTPLNSVIGFANVIRKNKGARLTREDLTYLDRIIANGRHLLALVNDVLDIARVEAGRLTVTTGIVAVDQVLRDVAAQLEGQPREAGVELRADVPDDMTPIETDGVLLRQVLINLAGNALKFTRQGSVVLSADVDPESGRPICVRVQDTGIGIPPERLQAIFEPFEQADAATHVEYGGTGLGLAISREICQALGFELTVESEPGKGSTFTVRMDSTVRSERSDASRASESVSESDRSVPNSGNVALPRQSAGSLEPQRR